MGSSWLASRTVGATAPDPHTDAPSAHIYGQEDHFEPMKIEAELKTVGDMEPEETKEFASWVWRTRDLGMFDPDVIGYPRAMMLKARDEDGALLYVPLQPVLMYEAIAAKPGINPRQEALSLRRINELVEQVQRDAGYGESYFICRDDRVADLCVRHGFEELK